MSIASRLPSLFLILVALASIATLSPPAAAKQPIAPPEIESFTVTPEELYPGAELTFTVEGTPRARATVKIGGVTRTILLKEVSAGVYEGMYTERRTDRAIAGSSIRATLRARGQSASDTIKIPWRAVPAPVVHGDPAITSFGVVPIAQIEPGAELKFTLSGTPGAAASFTIDGVVKDVPMREVRSGQYEGGYTIRQRDRFPPGIGVSGVVAVNGRYVRTPLAQPLIADAKSPVIAQAAPVITSFGVVPIARIEPGAELKFTLSGTPGAAASFTIDGVVKDVPMREMRSGQYEGGYTIRQRDRFPPGIGVSGAVTVVDGRYVRTPLAQPLIGP